MRKYICLLVFQLLPVQSGPIPRVTQFFVSETASDLLLDSELDRFFKDAGDGDLYYYNKVDLNADGFPEVLVYLEGAHLCGSRGCDLWILALSNGEYNVRGVITAAWRPVVVSEKRTNGWRDIIFRYRDYGPTMPSFYGVHKFDGKVYSSTTLRLQESVEGAAYLDTRSEPAGYGHKIERVPSRSD